MLLINQNQKKKRTKRGHQKTKDKLALRGVVRNREVLLPVVVVPGNVEVHRANELLRVEVVPEVEQEPKEEVNLPAVAVHHGIQNANITLPGDIIPHVDRDPQQDTDLYHDIVQIIDETHTSALHHATAGNALRAKPDGAHHLAEAHLRVVDLLSIAIDAALTPATEGPNDHRINDDHHLGKETKKENRSHQHVQDHEAEDINEEYIRLNF